MSQQYSPYEPPRQPGQPHPQHGSQGQLVVVMRKPFGPLSASLMSPNVAIDGYPAPARWEHNSYPVIAGRHQVRGSTRYLWEFGAAELSVEILPGQTVQVHYSPPLITFAAGRMGFEQQPRPGMLVFWALLSLPIVILLIVFGSILLSSLGS